MSRHEEIVSEVRNLKRSNKLKRHKRQDLETELHHTRLSNQSLLVNLESKKNIVREDQTKTGSERECQLEKQIKGKEEEL
jgi:hypothetical protein